MSPLSGRVLPRFQSSWWDVAGFLDSGDPVIAFSFVLPFSPFVAGEGWSQEIEVGIHLFNVFPPAQNLALRPPS